MNAVARAAMLGHPQPEATYRALERLAVAALELRLFTVMELDRARGVARRSHTSMPGAYPVSGEKPLPTGPWREAVEERKEVFVANSIKAIAEVFPDHERIRSLGCESCLNLPVVAGGELLGTLNCLAAAGHFTPERVAAAEELRGAGTLALLVAERVRGKGGEHG